MLTYDQFRELVAKAIDDHISMDATLSAGDREWEIDNFADKLGHSLRIEGFQIPKRPPEPPRRDLSEFEGM